MGMLRRLGLGEVVFGFGGDDVDILRFVCV
jgi:hypothetical protein